MKELRCVFVLYFFMWAVLHFPLFLCVYVLFLFSGWAVVCFPLFLLFFVATSKLFEWYPFWKHALLASWCLHHFHIVYSLCSVCSTLTLHCTLSCAITSTSLMWRKPRQCSHPLRKVSSTQIWLCYYQYIFDVEKAKPLLTLSEEGQ